MRRWAPPGAAVKEPFWVPVARMAALRMHRRRWRGFVNHLGPDSRNSPPNPEAEPRKRVRMSRYTAVDSESFQGAWGYCAVVGTRDSLLSGHRIPDPVATVGLNAYVVGLRECISLGSPP